MINRWFFTNLPTLRQVGTRLTYEYVSLLDQDHHLLCLNHGYADLDPDARPLELSREDEKHRYEIQLYHHIACRIPWDGLDALEVSSGRGGGASYILRHFRPRSLTGVDFSTAAIRFCRHHYSVPGLSFVQDDAEALRFPDSSFDVVINLEASLYYPHVERFFRQVVRVLRPNGYFLYADMRYAEELETWQAQLRDTGLELLSEEDITRNVIRALALSRERKIELIQRYVPRILREPFTTFAGIRGPVPRHLGSGERIYRSYVFRKKNTA